jgi:hypothetical protein
MATRVNARVAPLTNTAIEDCAAPLAGAVEGAGCAVKAQSENETPAVVPVTCSAYPAAVGATEATRVVTYVHGLPEQSRPPYTSTPSRDEPTTRLVAYVPPHAYTRFPAVFARSIACPIVATGAAIVPAFVSLPVVATNTPSSSEITQASSCGVRVRSQAAPSEPSR